MQVLALELHKFSNDVEEITDKAVKELKQEEGMQVRARVGVWIRVRAGAGLTSGLRTWQVRSGTGAENCRVWVMRRRTYHAPRTVHP